MLLLSQMGPDAHMRMILHKPWVRAQVAYLANLRLCLQWPGEGRRAHCKSAGLPWG
jgi:hypothetical protein